MATYIGVTGVSSSTSYSVTFMARVFTALKFRPITGQIWPRGSKN